MADLLLKAEGIACRACGATRAPRADNCTLMICGNCHNQLSYSMGHKPNLTEDDLNAWLARRLFLDMKRLEQFGVTGRCEAISDWKFNNKARNRGLQCGHSAKTMRDGRRVCNSHGELATRTTYVNESPCDGYDHLREIMTRLARIDPKLKQCMQLACEAA